MAYTIKYGAATSVAENNNGNTNATKVAFPESGVTTLVVGIGVSFNATKVASPFSGGRT